MSHIYIYIYTIYKYIYIYIYMCVRMCLYEYIYIYICGRCEVRPENPNIPRPPPGGVFGSAHPGARDPKTPT